MRVVITEKGYLASLPKLERPVRLRQVFDLASDLDWTVSLQGQHWDR